MMIYVSNPKELKIQGTTTTTTGYFLEQLNDVLSN